MVNVSQIWERFKVQTILLGSLFLFLVVSLVLFLVFGGSRDRRFFYYPDNKYARVRAELHYVPSKSVRELEIKTFVSELVLGPVDIGMAPLYPEGTRARTVLLRDGILYLDFSRQILDFNNRIPLPLGEILALTERNIRANFMGIKKIVFTIEGREPGSPPYP